MTRIWVIATTSIAAWERVAPHIGSHRGYMEHLLDTGRLLASGPYVDEEHHPTGDGFALIAADSREEAERVANDDPLVREGLRSARVHCWQLNQLDSDALTERLTS